ncbi:ribonuclease R [Neptunomonas qingdaonensis]|uniref:Ribonuclease R n=1 Tax=Neptunomonas qingdaonensis TaxID=1045558 RepID=A0A1I2TXV9_9GAMM|nr:ribonuclease R [Neptunomonas qingdaonensis]SFG69019.1 ribonuclease R [Neptunomonas qingdaonensis]
MSKDWTQNDPEAQREADKYQNPVPSREYILDFLLSWGAPISHGRLCAELKVDDEDGIEAVSRRLKAMCRDGQLMSNRKNEFGLIKKMDLISGRVIGHRDGFGFVKPDEGGNDLFISPRQMRQVFDGDRVVVQEIGVDHKGRREGKIVEVLEHCTHKLVGRFKGSAGFGHLRPENQRITQQVMVIADPDSALVYEDDQLVVVELTQQPGKRNMPQGRVIEVLGDHMAAGMEIQVAIHNYDIPNEWPDAIHQEIGDLTPEVEESAKLNRVDLRHLPFVTIDGEDARDFDDAVYAEVKGSGGWRLWVAIADVSWYVLPATALDQEALKRGNSVYFPEFVVPMLPELLSNGLCSLNPNADRLAMVCEMTVSAAGVLSGYQFYEAVINSQARLTYTKVGAMLMEPESDDGAALRNEYSHVVPHLEHLYSLYFALRAARVKRGAIDFDTTESRMIFGPQRKIEQIIPVIRNDAHKLIEECMLCANVATARFLSSADMPTLYRVHDGPKVGRLESLRAYLGELGLNLGGGDEPDPKDYQQLAEWIEERPDRHVIQTMMLRSMAQAVYSPENHGHFGLAYPAYTHFTSPIRRYPDLLVHRAIRALIHSDSQARTIRRPEGFSPNPAFRYRYTTEQVVQLGEHCSMTERRADDATRDVEAWLKCEFMQDQVGHEYEGVVSAVTGFGLFIELESVYIEGLIHITALPSDYYHFDAAKQRLVGERTRKVFKLGDRLRVQVARVDLDDRKIDFELIGTLNSGQEVKAKVSQRQLLAEGKIGPEGDRPKSKERSGRGASKSKTGGKGKTDTKKSGHQGSAHKKAHLSAAEREVAALSKGGEGKSKKARKRRSKKTKKPTSAK